LAGGFSALRGGDALAPEYPSIFNTAVATQIDDAAVAAGIARKVDERSGRRRAWFEVRVLMGEFEIERLSTDARDRMTRALKGVGITSQPPLDTVHRRDTVVLSSGDGAGQAPAPTASSDALENVLTARICRPNQPVRETAFSELDSARGDGVAWLDIRDTFALDPVAVRAALNAHCRNELTPEMVDDLLSPDPRPKVVHYAGGAIRGVSAFSVSADESDEGADEDSKTKAGVLEFQPVEFLVGVDWIITCWHEVEIYRGAERVCEGPPSQREEVFHEVSRSWSSGDLSSAGDLAVLVLYELSLTFAPAYRELRAWEEEWELDFFRRPDRVDQETLLDARAAAAVLYSWLAPLNPPGMRKDINRGWFPGVTGTPDSGGHERAIRIDDRIDSSLRSLREFTESMRSSFDLLHVRTSELERKRDDRFQRTIAIGGAVILIPTLVAGVMGANTWVPGEYGESAHWAFVVFLVLVFGSGLLAWLLLRRMGRADERDE
jgi:Mg2+ and Co2+ transporter CorA